jgi:hypothetical protein
MMFNLMDANRDHLVGQTPKLRKFDANGAGGRPGMSAYVTDRSKLNDPRVGGWTEDLSFDEATALRRDPKLTSTFEAARSTGAVLVIRKPQGKQGRRQRTLSWPDDGR